MTETEQAAPPEQAAPQEQAHAVLDEDQASYEQGKANLELAKVSADRWQKLLARGVVSRQENASTGPMIMAGDAAGVRSSTSVGMMPSCF